MAVLAVRGHKIVMMKIPVAIIFFLTAFTSFGQADERDNEEIIHRAISELTDEQLGSSGPTRLKLTGNNDEARELALQDIRKGTPFLLLKGGAAPTLIATDPKFEKRYGIYFYEYGCSGPAIKIVEEYNRVIFEHLTQKFGKIWIEEVRKDVIGLKEWKRN